MRQSRNAASGRLSPSKMASVLKLRLHCDGSGRLYEFGNYPCGQRRVEGVAGGQLVGQILADDRQFPTLVRRPDAQPQIELGEAVLRRGGVEAFLQEGGAAIGHPAIRNEVDRAADRHCNIGEQRPAPFGRTR